VAAYQLRYTNRAINPLKDLLAFFELLKLIKNEKPDIIHLNSSKIGITGSLAGWLIKKVIGHLSFIIIYTVHGWVFNEPLPWLLKKLYFILEKWTSRFKYKIITVSEHDRGIALKNKIARPEKLVTIPNGLDQAELNFLDKNTAREKLLALLSLNEQQQTSHEPQIIGTIANLYPTKGINYLICAAQELIKKRPNLIFLIIGDGPEKSYLQSFLLSVARRAKEGILNHQLQRNFFFLGKIEEAYKYLKAFDIFVLPSVKEGLPYTLLEAQAAELPIIATNVGGIPEMLTDQLNGLLVPPADPDKLTEAINKLLDNPELALKLKQNSRLTAEKFSFETTLKSTQKLYQ